MSIDQIPISRESLLEILQILGIPHETVADTASLGSTERNLLDNSQLKHLVNNYFFMGTDGTSASFSDEDYVAPGIVVGSAVAWGLEGAITKTREITCRYILKQEDRESNSGFRSMLELMLAVCTLKAAKLGKYDCSSCPFRDYQCGAKNQAYPPWEWFEGREGIAFVDLPVEFNFVKSLHKGTYTKDFFEENLRLAFKDMKEHELKIVFVTHKSRLKVVSEVIQTQLDLAINSLSERARSLIDLVSRKMKNLAPASLDGVARISTMMKSPAFFDFDLLEPFFNDIGTPSPSFQVEPSQLNDQWGDLRSHYFTWGYKEQGNGDMYYAPSCWVRIGYTPALTPELAHMATCLEMILGKGHAISLTLAHTACNEKKDIYIKVLTEKLNKDLPAKHRMGYNVKTINKWKLMKHGR